MDTKALIDLLEALIDQPLIFAMLPTRLLFTGRFIIEYGRALKQQPTIDGKSCFRLLYEKNLLLGEVQEDLQRIANDEDVEDQCLSIDESAYYTAIGIIILAYWKARSPCDIFISPSGSINLKYSRHTICIYSAQEISILDHGDIQIEAYYLLHTAADNDGLSQIITLLSKFQGSEDIQAQQEKGSAKNKNEILMDKKMADIIGTMFTTTVASITLTLSVSI